MKPILINFSRITLSSINIKEEDKAGKKTLLCYCLEFACQSECLPACLVCLSVCPPPCLSVCVSPAMSVCLVEPSQGEDSQLKTKSRSSRGESMSNTQRLNPVDFCGLTVCCCPSPPKRRIHGTEAKSTTRDSPCSVFTPRASSVFFGFCWVNVV